MTVNNKYKIGEKVYFINTENKAMCDEVKAIYVYVYEDYMSVVYYCERRGCFPHRKRPEGLRI